MMYPFDLTSSGSAVIMGTVQKNTPSSPCIFCCFDVAQCDMHVTRLCFSKSMCFWIFSCFGSRHLLLAKVNRVHRLQWKGGKTFPFFERVWQKRISQRVKQERKRNRKKESSTVCFGIGCLFSNPVWNILSVFLWWERNETKRRKWIKLGAPRGEKSVELLSEVSCTVRCSAAVCDTNTVCHKGLWPGCKSIPSGRVVGWKDIGRTSAKRERDVREIIRAVETEMESFLWAFQRWLFGGYVGEQLKVCGCFMPRTSRSPPPGPYRSESKTVMHITCHSEMRWGGGWALNGNLHHFWVQLWWCVCNISANTALTRKWWLLHGKLVRKLSACIFWVLFAYCDLVP